MGLPSALQLSVAGSWRGTVVSMGCSTIRGGCEPAEEKWGDGDNVERNVKYKNFRGVGGVYRGSFRFQFSAASVDIIIVSGLLK